MSQDINGGEEARGRTTRNWGWVWQEGGQTPTDSAQLHSTSLQDVYQNIQGSQPRDVKEVKYTV